MRRLHAKKPQSLYFWRFGEISFSVWLIWDGFPPKFPIAKMEKSGYYECGFRLVNSIFGSRCHGTEMKVNGVWCPASRSLWDFPQLEDKSVTPKVSRMQSAKAAAHKRELYRHIRSYRFWLIVHINLDIFLARSTWCTCYNTGTHAGVMQALPHGVPRNLRGITDEQSDKWNCSQTSI